MEEMVWELVRKLESMAPHVWEMTKRQVLVNAIIDIGWLVATLTGLALSVRAFMIVRARKEDSFSKEPDMMFVGICIIGLLAVAFVIGQGVLTVLINPEWAAVQLWLKAIGD